MLDELHRNLIPTSANVPKIRCITCGEKMPILTSVKRYVGYAIRTHDCMECCVTERFVIET